MCLQLLIWIDQATHVDLHCVSTEKQIWTHHTTRSVSLEVKKVTHVESTSTERHSFQAFLHHTWPTVIVTKSVVIRCSISFLRRVRFTVRSWRPSETLSAHSFIRTLSVVNSQCAIADHVWGEARESVKLKAAPSLPFTAVDSEADCMFSQERIVLRRGAKPLLHLSSRS